MTETVSGQSKGTGENRGGGQQAAQAGRGLTIDRIFTTAGVHPYDQVSWERRDVVQQNWKTGETVFEQRGVEFPDFWSVNASTIVTSKYFRGAVGTDAREWSLRQLVDRVVKTYRRAGEQYGYFATPDDAEVFEHELAWMLVHQVFSFNSPVWFNVGTPSPQQVSACQPYDALVNTTAGLIPIGKLVEADAVGTKVYDAHGVTRIVATKANGVKDVLRLHTKAGYRLDVTADHLVWRSTGDGTGRFVRAGTLRSGDQLEYVDAEFGSAIGRPQIARIENLGPMEVYDIQTESGEYLSGGLRVHNCFILAVDDSMHSILNWYREEGLIFKGGSGSGLNLSRIRSSKELLSSGGTASGPVSFMRGADASAGTIKSGGATRRAAKMVVLDVDHPDVEEFIETKAREEDKIRALRDAGFDMDLGGKDIVSVQYQNANNSIRVSDEFMQAVENGDPFGLRARLTGEVVETVDAKGLFRKMAQAAWECADPGIQYDSTINDWHTNPETGRITASNPCFTGDTLVHTDKGLIRFDELIGRANLGEEFQVWTHDATNVGERATRAVLTTPEAYMITGFNHVVRLRLANGMELTCTPSHRIWTENRGYVEAENLRAVDRILALDVPTPAVNADDALPAAALVDAWAFGERRDEMYLPTTWSFELAHYLGWLIGDGSTSSTVSTVYGSAEDRVEIMPLHQNLIEAINGGRELKISEQSNGTAQLRLTRGAFRRFLEGLGVTKATSSDKVVPASIYQAPPQYVAAFLQGLFDADGTAVLNRKSGSYVSLTSTSIELLRGTQRLLSTFGIVSRIYKTKEARKAGYRHTRPDGTVVTYGSKASYQLRISSSNVEKFGAHVNFRLTRKAGNLSDILVARTPNEVDPTTRLVDRIDEGVKLTYNLSEPRNHSYIANGLVVRNCSEYMSLDNSSCNLASLNLMTFLCDDDTFDADLFRRSVELIITAMDISICFADFPTEAITETTRAYRQLGIGYANLGALLMATGHGYDSEGGRSLAAAITSLMTGAAYKRSAELAGVVGPYDGYARNAEAHKRVMRKHAAANDALRTLHDLDEPVHALATTAWQECLAIGEVSGWRNGQASLLAPTGTIGLMMDCDTTGIEPDLALVKFKKLVGGGSMQIVNQTVPRALRRLGYQEEQVEAIVEHIAEHGNVLDAPGLRQEHYEVFDCAMGARSISPMGHVNMMAAVQPHLSGAISKTVNVPESVTVKEIEDIYFQGWKLGLKALAIYRDNCKVGQPLSASKRSGSEAAGAPGAETGREVVVEYRPTRKRLPKSRPSRTTSFTVGGAEGYMTAGSYPDDGLGEVFLKLGKQGSTLAGVMDAFSIAISIALQYGVPLETYVQKFTNMRFEPSGMTDDPDVRMAQSVVDYIFRRLALDYLPFESRSELGVYTAAERARQLDTGAYAPIEDDVDVEAMRQSAPVEKPALGAPAADVDEVEEVIEASAKPVPPQAHTSTELLEVLLGTSTDAPLCFTCGTKMRPAGSCYVCEGCGSTSGCS